MHKLVISFVLCTAVMGLNAHALAQDAAPAQNTDNSASPAQDSAAAADNLANTPNSDNSNANPADAPAAETAANTANPADAPAAETAANTANPADAPAAETAANTESPAISPAAANVSSEPTMLTDAILDKKLREVSTSVDTLKEDTFTTKSRLLLLREEVLQRSMNGSRLQLRHKNDMGGQYELVQVVYAIDQSPVFSQQDPSGKLDDLDDVVLYDDILTPGTHQLMVLYVYKGRPWGVFRYMTDYTFRVESGYDFVVDEGKAAELTVTASENGNFFTAYEERPGVSFNYEQFDLATVASSAENDKKESENNAASAK